MGSSLDLLRSWLLRSGRVTGDGLARLESEGPLTESALRRGLLSQDEADWLERLPPDWKGALPPPSFAHYLIEVELGRGGMGIVYLAFDPRLGRRVAIKQLALKEEGSQAEAAKQRFTREAQAAATLAHPNLVQVFGAGVEAGCPYLAMEYVEGGDLEERLKQADETRPSFRQLVTWTSEVAAGLGAAHAAGIIHRDVKPANVLIDLEGRARLTDFGLAKRLDDDVHLTRSSALLGTPVFMSPEQAGRQKEMGPETDVFSLGGVLYYGLTGTFPFGAESLTEILVAVASEDPTPPRTIEPRIPLDLENVVLRCLEKDPSARYPDGAALARELQHFLRGEAVTARSLTRVERLRRWARRNPALATLGALSACVVAGLLLTLAAGGWWSSVQIKTSLAQEQARAREALQARGEAEAALAKAEAARTREAEARAREEEATREVRRLFASQEESLARALRDRGLSLLQQKAHNEAAALLAASLASREDPLARGAFLNAWRQVRRLIAFEPPATPVSAVPSGGSEGFLLALRNGSLSRPADSRGLATKLRGVKPIAYLPFGEGELLFERGGRALELPTSIQATVEQATLRELPLESPLLGAVPRERQRIVLAETGGRVSLLEDLGVDPVARARLGPLTCLWGRTDQPTLFGGREGQVWIWPQGGEPRLVTRLEAPVLALACAGPQRLASLGADGAVRLWDGAGTALGALPTQRRVLCLDWAEDGHLLLGTREGVVEVWKTQPKPTLVSESWNLVEPIHALATRGPTALAVGRGNYATTLDFLAQRSITATINPPLERVVLDASGGGLLTASQSGIKRWRIAEGELVSLSAERGTLVSVAEAAPDAGWIVGTRQGELGRIPLEGGFKLAPLDAASEIRFVGLSEGEVVGISAAGALGRILRGGKQLERKRIPLLAKTPLRAALLEGGLRDGRLFVDTGAQTHALGLGSRPGGGRVLAGRPLARWRRADDEVTTLVSRRDVLLRWDSGVGLQAVYTAAGRLRQLDAGERSLLARHDAGLDLLGNGYQVLHRWVAESEALRSASSAPAGRRVAALYDDRLACFEVDRRGRTQESLIKTGGGESWGATNSAGVLTRLEGQLLSSCRLETSGLASFKVDGKPELTRRLRLDPSGRYALVVARDVANVTDLQSHQAGPKARNKTLRTAGLYALEDGAWLSPDVFILTAWTLSGPEKGRLVQLRVDLGPDGGDPRALPLGAPPPAPTDRQERRVLSCTSPGREGTLAFANEDLVVVQHLNRITGPTAASVARKVLTLQQIELPKAATPTALTLDPDAEQLYLAGRNQAGQDSIWITDLPEPSSVADSGRPRLPLGARLWQGRFRARELVVSPDRRWLLATGEGFMVFDLESRALQAKVSGMGSFHAAFRSPTELVYLEDGLIAGTWDLAREGLTTPRDQLVERVAQATGLRVVGGEVLLEPDAHEAYLLATRGR